METSGKIPFIGLLVQARLLRSTATPRGPAEEAVFPGRRSQRLPLPQPLSTPTEARVGSFGPTLLVLSPGNLRAPEITANGAYNPHQLPGRVPDGPWGYFDISHPVCPRSPHCTLSKWNRAQALRTTSNLR